METVSRFFFRRFKRGNRDDETNHDPLSKLTPPPQTSPSKTYLFSPLQLWLTPLISSISRTGQFEPTISLPSLPQDATFLRSYAAPLYSGSRLSFLLQWHIGGLILVSSMLSVFSTWGMLGSVALLRRVIEEHPPSISLVLSLFGIYTFSMIIGRVGEQMTRIQSGRISTLLRSTVYEKSLKLSVAAREQWSLDAIKANSTEDIPFLETYFANGVDCAIAPSQWVLAWYQLSGQLGKGPAAVGLGAILFLIAVRSIVYCIATKRASIFINDATARLLIPSLAALAAFAWTARLPVIPTKLSVPAIFTSLILYAITYESATKFFPAVKREPFLWLCAGRIQNFLMAEEDSCRGTLSSDDDHEEEDKSIDQETISSVHIEETSTSKEKPTFNSHTLSLKHLKRIGVYRVLTVILCFLSLAVLQTLSSYLWLHPFLFLLPAKFVNFYAIFTALQIPFVIAIGFILERSIRNSLDEMTTTAEPNFAASLCSITTALSALLASTFMLCAPAPLLLIPIVPTWLIIPYLLSRYRTSAREFRRTQISFSCSTNRELVHTITTVLSPTSTTITNLPLEEHEDLLQNFNSLLDREHASSVLLTSLNTWFAIRAEAISIILILCCGLLGHFGWLMLRGRAITLFASFMFSGYIKLLGQAMVQMDEEVDNALAKEQTEGVIDSEEGVHMLPYASYSIKW